MEQQNIEKLTQLGSDAVQTTVEAYTKWFIIESSVFLVLSALLIAVSVWLWRSNKKEEISETLDIEKSTLSGIAAILLVIGVLLIPNNLSTIISPKAWAIHQILKDVK